jgi:predicted component of type VI protein secretion system
MLSNANLFLSFLKEPERPPAKGAVQQAAPAEGQAGGTLDALLRELGARPAGEVVPLKELMDIAGGSLQALIEALTALAQRRLVEEVDGGVRVTPFGKEIADSLRPPVK